MPENEPVSSGASNGQPPTATPPGAPAIPPTSGATPPVPGAADANAINNPEAKKYADEAASERTARKKLEAELKKYQDAQSAADLAKLDELGKAQKQLADLQAAHAEYQTQAQQRIIRALVKAEAAQMGLNPDLAARLVDLTDIEFTDDGDPKNLHTLLKKAAEQYGLTPTNGAAGQGQSQRPPASSGGATNPGAGARTGVITKATYAAMSQADRVARNNEVLEIMRRNGGRLPD